MTKTEITAFDLHFLARELQTLVDERLDKIYVLEERGVLLTFGNKVLLQAAPGKLWTPLERPPTPEQIHPFAAQLRKLIGNSKVLKLEQVCSERILALHLNRSEKHFVLYLEVYGRGNVILTDADNAVITALATNTRIQRGAVYELPETPDTFHMSEHDFAVRFAQSTENVSKTLAVQFGLGKVLAEELCVRAGVPPTEKATPEQAGELLSLLKLLLAQPIRPQIIADGSIVIDAVPVLFDCYANKKRENIDSFGKALDRVFAMPAEAVKAQKLSPVKQELQKIELMIAMQQKRLNELEQKALDEHKKGEWMYEHYQDVKQLLVDVLEARKTLSWKEVKAKFKQIKELNEATGDMIVEF